MRASRYLKLRAEHALTQAILLWFIGAQTEGAWAWVLRGWAAAETVFFLALMWRTASVMRLEREGRDTR